MSLLTFFAEASSTLLIIVFVVLIVLFGFAWFFFDFLMDAWRIPFAFLADIADFLALVAPTMFNGNMGWIAVGLSFLVFLLVAGNLNLWLRITFGLIAAAEAFISVSFPFSNPAIGIILGIVPTASILMTIGAVID